MMQRHESLPFPPERDAVYLYDAGGAELHALSNKPLADPLANCGLSLSIGARFNPADSPHGFTAGPQ